MNMGERNLVPVLTYLFRRIEKRLTARQPDHPRRGLADARHPRFRDKIREWLKVLRKANCAVVLATQSISDAERSGIIDVLKESCPTKICLPNGAAREPGTREFYERIGFNERQIEIVATATRSATTTSSRLRAGACSTWRSGRSRSPLSGVRKGRPQARPRAHRTWGQLASPLAPAEGHCPCRNTPSHRVSLNPRSSSPPSFLCAVQPPHAWAGGVTGQATEWTQLANNAELISLVGKSAEQ